MLNGKFTTNLSDFINFCVFLQHFNTKSRNNDSVAGEHTG